MIDFQPYLETIKTLCRQYDVLRLDVFGSALSSNFTAASDIDFLVRFDYKKGGSFVQYFELKENLEAMFHRPVDLVVEDAVKNPYLIESIQRSRKNVYQA